MNPMGNSMTNPRGAGSFPRLILALLLTVFLAPSTAQSQTSTRAQAPRITPGDLVKVEIVGRPDLSGTFQVDPQGSIPMPILGAVRASGRTTEELATDLSRRVSLIQREIPLITVTIVESGMRRLYVLGSVIMPGAYPVTGQATVWDAIGKAGGPTEDANLSAVEVISGDARTYHPPTIIDVNAAIRAGALDSLPALRPGDTVRVPSRMASAAAGGAGVVYIMGAVAAQGAMPYEQDMDLARLLSRASPSPDANFKAVEIVRNFEGRLLSFKVNMRKNWFENADAAGNPPLQPGDTVYLNRSRQGAGLLSYLGLIGTVLALATSITYLSNN